MIYRTDKPNFLEFWVKMAKMTWKVKVNDPYFQYQLKVSPNACLVQIWWFQLKSVTSYRADKVKFTDRQDGQTDGRTDGGTDRWTDTGNDNTPSAFEGWKWTPCLHQMVTSHHSTDLSFKSLHDVYRIFCFAARVLVFLETPINGNFHSNKNYHFVQGEMS